MFVSTRGDDASIKDDFSVGTFLSYLNLGTTDVDRDPLSSELGFLTSLSDTIFEFNSLTGTLPSQLSSLTTLSFLDLTSYSFMGTLPSQVGSWTSLSYPSLAFLTYSRGGFRLNC